MDKIMNKLKKEIETMKSGIEEDYSMDYDEMEECYWKNSSELGIEYHPAVAYIVGLEKALNIVKKTIREGL